MKEKSTAEIGRYQDYRGQTDSTMGKVCVLHVAALGLI